jgi:hypothetical protein
MRDEIDNGLPTKEKPRSDTRESVGSGPVRSLPKTREADSAVAHDLCSAGQ